MALNRIERWTRDVLEHEAKKRGIRDPEVRTHAELVRLILRHDYASPNSLRNARKLVGSLLETAGATLRAYAPSAAAPPLAAAPRPPAPRPAAAVQAPIAPEQPAPTGSETIAQPKAAAATTSAKDTQAVAASVRLDHSRPGPRELHVRWAISEQAAARARELLGSDGELAVRLVSVRADPTHVVLSDITEHGPIDHAGEWVAELASADTHCVTSVGVRSAGRFVSIVHRSSRPERIEAE